MRMLLVVDKERKCKLVKRMKKGVLDKGTFLSRACHRSTHKQIAPYTDVLREHYVKGSSSISG